MKELNPFYYALSLLDSLFGITIQEDDFEEIAIIGWNFIGNKRTKLYRFKASVSKDNNSIELPCNVFQIEAVTTNWEEWNYSTNDTPNGDLHSAFTESYIENRKAFKSPLYSSGKFIKYERVGNTLYFDHVYGDINILYRGLVLDDSGLPEITDKEAVAIATYCAYVIKFKEGMRTNNSQMIQLSEVLRRQWLTRADQARSDYYISQNEWDQILDVKASWNRKQFGKSLKLYK